MKVCVLFNPKAGTANRLKAIRRHLGKKHQLTLIETRDAVELGCRAVEAAKGGYGAIAVAGGDGTLHTVINSLGPEFPEIPLAIIPLGTGNDFCRTLAVPLNSEFATVLDHRVRKRSIDVVWVEGGNSPYMINAATGGFSGRVAADVTHDLKQAWGPLAYLRGAAGPIAQPVFYRLKIRYDRNPAESVLALNIVVANGRFAAGGLAVAPTANPEDGQLDVVVVRAGDFLDASAVAAALMAGDYLADDNVTHRRVKHVEIEADPPMPFSIDGELVETSRLTFEVVPHAVRVYPGPDYRPDPAGQPIRPIGMKRAVFAILAGGLRLVARSLRWPVAGITLAAIALFFATWLTLGVLAGEYIEFNHRVGMLFQEWSNPSLTRAATIVTHLGDPGLSTAITASVAILFASWRRYTDAVGIVATLAVVGVIELALKPWLAIPRPEGFMTNLAVIGYGYPSGHALRASGLCLFVGLVLASSRSRMTSRWVTVLALMGFAVAIALSRVYLGVHSMTDVLAGFLIGAAVGSLFASLAHPFRQTHGVQ